ncbi:MAG: diacylglycerol kinase [Firmicutes bacterium HGW-Firmicutes-2]|jgi:dihydrofolate reductase|nr:MAG: diacylglycerol kinase [Firmicutes bacterium HGW-Firmicutes-2]
MSVFFYGCVTMDGFLADKNHNLDWLYQTGTIEETDYDNFYKSMDITIMGKRTYNEIENIENIDSLYKTTQNYVFTHAESLTVNSFIPMNGDVIDFVKQIDKGKNIWIVGGNTILAPLLDHDMVDNIIIQIAPVLLGRGIPLFSQKEVLKRFYLEEVKKYGQFAELIYRKV